MNRLGLNICVLVVLLSACTTLPELTGHRVVKMIGEPGARMPYLWIALTNKSEYTLRNSVVDLIGVDDPSAEQQTKTDWYPGQIWLLELKKPFDCRIPIKANITYEYQKSQKKKPTRLKKPDEIALSGVPTAFPLDSLDECKKKEAARFYISFPPVKNGGEWLSLHQPTKVAPQIFEKEIEDFDELRTQLIDCKSMDEENIRVQIIGFSNSSLFSIVNSFHEYLRAGANAEDYREVLADVKAIKRIITDKRVSQAPDAPMLAQALAVRIAERRADTVCDLLSKPGAKSNGCRNFQSDRIEIIDKTQKITWDQMRTMSPTLRTSATTDEAQQQATTDSVEVRLLEPIGKCRIPQPAQ